MSMNGPNGISQTHKLKDSIIYSYFNNQVKHIRIWYIIDEGLICKGKKK